MVLKDRVPPARPSQNQTDARFTSMPDLLRLLFGTQRCVVLPEPNYNPSLCLSEPHARIRVPQTAAMILLLYVSPQRAAPLAWVQREAHQRAHVSGPVCPESSGMQPFPLIQLSSSRCSGSS